MDPEGFEGLLVELFGNSKSEGDSGLHGVPTDGADEDPEVIGPATEAPPDTGASATGAANPVPTPSKRADDEANTLALALYAQEARAAAPSFYRPAVPLASEPFPAIPVPPGQTVPAWTGAPPLFTAADFARGSLLLQLQPGHESAFQQVLPSALTGGLTIQSTSVPGFFQLFGDPGQLAQLGQTLASNPLVSYVEPEQEATVALVPNDPSYGSLWGMNGTFGIRAPQAWDVRTNTVTAPVAVVDTGVDYRHPDLYLNIWINQQEIPPARRVNLVDTDSDNLITFWDLNNPVNQGTGKITDLNANGRIDGGDLLVAYNPNGTGGWADGIDQDDFDSNPTTFRDDLIGWNFLNNTNNPLDDNNHGTHVAGTIGAIGNNAVGVVGVSWKAQIVALKFLNSSGSGSYTNGANAIRYAADKGIPISNHSWGGTGGSSTLSSAISYARSRGHLVVAAAGNNNRSNDTTPFYPASYTFDNVIAVASITSSGARSSFSNWGVVSVDIGAPGSSILSTVRNNGYATFNGTSMASPHVAGTAALVKAQNPSWTYTQVRSRILTTATPTTSLSGLVATGGRVNAQAALGTINQPPVLQPIPNQTIPSSQQSLTVTLSASDPDGHPITFSATGQSLAYVLDQQLGLTFTGNYWQNWGGRNEKWMIDATSQWYFILPNGQLYRWDGSSSATGTLIGTPGASHWTNPATLHDAIPNQPYATFSISGTQLTITRQAGTVSSIVATVTASDGPGGTDTEMFTITVTSP